MLVLLLLLSSSLSFYYCCCSVSAVLIQLVWIWVFFRILCRFTKNLYRSVHGTTVSERVFQYMITECGAQHRFMLCYVMLDSNPLTGWNFFHFFVWKRDGLIPDVCTGTNGTVLCVRQTAWIHYYLRHNYSEQQIDHDYLSWLLPCQVLYIICAFAM